MQRLESRLEWYFVVPGVGSDFELFLTLFDYMPKISQYPRPIGQNQALPLIIFDFYLLKRGFTNRIEQTLHLLGILLPPDLLLTPSHNLHGQRLLLPFHHLILIPVSILHLPESILHDLLPTQFRPLFLILLVGYKQL
jgi:hypothetical protein